MHDDVTVLRHFVVMGKKLAGLGPGLCYQHAVKRIGMKWFESVHGGGMS